MKTLPILLSVALLPVCGPAQNAEKVINPYLSLQLEMERAIKRGNAFLKTQQLEDGNWADPTIPALSALALTAAVRDPDVDPKAEEAAYVQKGYAWLMAQQKDDGGIYGKGLASYNTSSSIMSLVARGRKDDIPTLLKARAFLVDQQTDWGIKGETDNKYDGGIGYGGSYPHSDLSNTYLALESLYNSRQIARDGEHGKQPELNWQAALDFVSRCQNLTETNDQPFASDNPDDKGGAIYFPGDSKAGERELPDGTVALRSYGSMSYAALLSFIYSDLKADDPRLVAILEWLGKNYTLKENPGLGEQGLYYYYHTMAKALAAAGIEKLTLADGTEADWRRDLATLLVSNQKADGSWINENSRWWENDSVLVTAYVVMTLEQIYYTIPKG